MKNVTLRIVGVILTLAVLIGMVGVMPASAGNLTWSSVKMPKVVETPNANIFAIAADGKTIYVVDNVDATAGVGGLWKSTNGGTSWSNTGLATLPGDFTQIKVSQSSASSLIATDGTAIYKSTNGGVKWSDITPSTTVAIGDITSIDIGVNADGDAVYLFTDSADVFLYDGAWMNTQTAGGSLDYGSKFAGSALAAAFSPNYAEDGVIIAVGTDYVQGLVMDYEDGQNAWNNQIPDVEWTTSPSTAVIALASDFYESDTASKMFIGTDTAVYRVNPFARTAEVKLINAIDVASIAYNGTAAEGTLAVGNNDDTTVYTSAAADTATDLIEEEDLTGSVKSPNGSAPVTVAFADDVLYAGSEGDFSGLFTSSDPYTFFDGIAFLNVSDFDNIEFAGTEGMGTATMYQVLFDDNGNGSVDDPDTALVNEGTDDKYMLFVTTDSGTSYKLIYTSNAAYSVKLSPSIATDNTIYLIPAAASKSIKKSTNNGESFKTIYAPSTVNAFAAIDGTSYWIGNQSGIRKSTSGSAYVYLDGITPVALIPVPGFFVVFASNGLIYVSGDEGATFDRLGTTSDAIDNKCLDIPNKTIYGTNVAGDIVKWVYGTSDEWETVLAADDQTTLASVGYTSESLSGVITNIALSGGIWYVTASGLDYQVYRATALKADAFEPVPAGTTAKIGGAIITPGPNFKVAANADGANVVYAAVETALKATTYPYKWISMIDSIMNAPVAVSPAANASVPAVVDFSWNAVAGAKAYEIQVAYDESFTNFAYTPDPTAATIDNGVTALDPGRTYYWRVRVAPDSPIASEWSDAVKFTTMLTGTETNGLDVSGRIYPDNGATGISLKPAITWGTVAGATSYDFQLSTKSDFSTTVDAQTGLTSTVYSPAAALTNDTAYFWRVRAVNANGASAWVTSAFTTISAAAANPTTISIPTPIVNVAQPTVTVNVPPQTAVGQTGTPAWAWVVIAIGAVLVIAVIVLIARTRRV